MKMNKLKLSISIIFSIATSACGSIFVSIEDTSIVNETKVSLLPESDKKLWVALNRGADGHSNIFDSAKAVEVNGYRIIFSPGKEEIYIIKNKKVLIGIFEDTKYIFDDAIEAPGLFTESVYYQSNYIKYRKGQRVFEDYGLDGIDVQYELNSSNAESFLDGKKCERTIVAGAACCTDSSGELRPYKFTPSAGWELSTNPKLVANCQKKP